MTELFQNAGALCVGMIALIVLFIGALLISLGLFTLQRHRAAAGWPQVPGVVEVSEVVGEHHFKDKLMYRAKIRYGYGAPGGPYVGNKMANTGRLYATEKEAQREAARYPVGGTALVRYNPADPAEAVLERGASGGVLLVCFGLLCWIAPVAGGIAAGLGRVTIAAVLVGLVLLITVLMLKSGSSLARARTRGLLPPADSCGDADVRALRARGEERLAVRLYRELHGSGLKEARQAVEGMGEAVKGKGGDNG